MKYLFYASILLFSVNVSAWERCEYTQDIDQQINLAGTQLAVMARAGSLEINGVADSSEVQVEARICASSERLLNLTQVHIDAAPAQVAVETPKTGSGGWKNQYVYVDLKVNVPDNTDLTVTDSSGDLKITQVASLSLSDSSGDIEIHSVAGPVDVRDSSGDIDLQRTGAVTVQDSSGDINAEWVDGEFYVKSDSSGDINANRVQGNAKVRVDSSGGIYLTDIANDVLVEKDSSGDIRVKGVGGSFTVLRDGSGSISHREVSGNISLPRDKS